MKKPMTLFCCLLTAANLFSAEPVRNSGELERRADSLYSKNAAVLYYLDSGMLNYYEGNYRAAIEKLTAAEDLIYEYYTKSVSQQAMAMLTNESAVEYPGEDYEDIYINLFKALAYYKDGRYEEGFHELNAYRTKAQAVAMRHYDELFKARLAAKSNDSLSFQVSFHDSALGEYLTMLYYRSINDENQKAFSHRKLKEVFTTSSGIYNFQVPKSVDEELKVSDRDARLNFVVFSGISPYKTEKKEYYSNELTLSLPQLVIPKPQVNYISVKIEDAETGKTFYENLEQIENYGNICEDIFKARSKLIYYKSVARAMTKGTASSGAKVAGNILEESDSVLLSVLGGAMSAGAGKLEGLNEKTEKADLRHSNYFPGRADVGGITLKPGLYNITVSYFGDKKSSPLYSEYFNEVKVEKGKLNLVTSSSTNQEILENRPKKAGTKDNGMYPGVAVNSPSADKTVSVYDSVEEDKIYFDIGTEPEGDASSTFATVQYNWNQSFASSFKFMYSNSTDTKDEIEGYENATQVIKNRQFELNLLPFIYKNGGDFLDWSFSAGFSYQYIYESSFSGMFDTNGYMLDPEDIGKYFTCKSDRKGHLFAPRLGLNVNMPAGENFALKFQTYINPVYFLMLNQDVRYYSDQTSTNFDFSGDDSYSTWSSPYLEAKLSLDCFNFARLVSFVSYQKLSLQQMGWAEDGLSLKPYEDTQDITKMRLGLEFLAGNKRRARVRGGVYYQKEWNKSSFSGGELDSDDKFIISIGSER